jgi:hypothetical protein
MESLRRPGAAEPQRPRRFVPRHGLRPRARRRHGRLPGGVQSGRAGRGGPDPDPVAGFPRHRLVDRPAAGPPRGPPDGRAEPFPRQDRAQDLGFLRDLRRRRRPLAAAGQLPGIPRRRAGPSHLADQHGAGAAGEPDRPRLRLHPGRATARAHGAVPGDDGGTGTPPRPFLQLVRHAVAATAAPGLHLDGGQRQPGGPSADPAPGFDGAARPADPGDALAGRPDRHPGDTRGGRKRNRSRFAGKIPQGARIGIQRPAGHAHGGAGPAGTADAIRRGGRRRTGR